MFQSNQKVLWIFGIICLSILGGKGGVTKVELFAKILFELGRTKVHQMFFKKIVVKKVPPKFQNSGGEGCPSCFETNPN